MYDETQDFQQHKTEIDALLYVLGAAGVSLTKDMTLLDLGAGQGMRVGFLASLVGSVVGADNLDYSALYSGEFLKLLTEKHLRHGLDLPLSRIAFHQADALKLMYRDGLFDCVACFTSLAHIENPGAALQEMIRVTKPGGYIFISIDPIWTADSGSHFYHRIDEPW